MGSVKLFLLFAALLLVLSEAKNILFYEGSIDPAHNRYVRTLANQMKANYSVSFLTSTATSLPKSARKDDNYVFQSPFTPRDVSSMYTLMTSWGNMGASRPSSSDLEMTCNGTARDVCVASPRDLTYPNLLLAHCQGLLQDQDTLRTIKAKNFDFYVANPVDLCSVVLAQYLEIPYAFAVPTSIENGRHDAWVQLPSPSAYVPHLSTDFSDDMTFPQRVANTLVSTFVPWIDEARVRRPYEQLKEGFDIRPDQDLREAMLWTEIWIFNVHFTFDFPRPLMPNLVPVGGLVTKNATKLSKKWQELMNNSSRHGVVIASFGSLLDLNLLPETAEALARALARIPQTVVWKYVGEPPAGLGNNTILVKDFPQNDLLAHPKIRAFVTHGESISLHEAIYHEAPMVVIPYYLDQRLNSKVVVSRGIGRRVLQHQFSEQKVFAALVTAMTDPKIRANIDELSYAFRDNFRHPLEEGALWLSHVIKFNGDHLRPVVHELYTFQYYLIDVSLFLLCLLLLPFVLLYYCLRCTCRCVMRVPKRILGTSSKKSKRKQKGE